VPGNHDLSNAIGFYKAMTPAVDASAMMSIFNRMMRPPVARTTATFDPIADVVNVSHDLGGVHFMFLTLWPDSRAREWMARDLKSVPASMPAIIFVHDQPDVEAKHFRNPNGMHTLSATDRFENLLTDVFADGPTIETPSLIEQRALEAFLYDHPNVVAYFHGNSNWNEFYDWTGPNRSIALHVFRVDSPIKGRYRLGTRPNCRFRWRRSMRQSERSRCVSACGTPILRIGRRRLRGATPQL
jgi:hypothetical protein